MANVNKKYLKMVEMAMLLAIVVVLQLVGGFIKFGPFSISLVLIPIVVGSILLGAVSGAVLGAVFGIVVLVQCATGVDAGGFILWGINPFLTSLLCVLKGAAAGFVPGLIYSAMTKKNNEIITSKATVAAIIASASAPIVNTGLFLLGMFLLFKDTLVAWSGGQNLLVYIITGLVGINFLIELVVNTVASPVINTVTKAIRKK